MPMILAHEWLFGAYMVFTWIRLLPAEGLSGSNSLVFMTCIVLAMIGITKVTHQTKAYAWRLRLLLYPIFMNLLFQQMRTAVPLINPVMFDTDLRGIDRLLFPDTPAMLLQAYASPVATELFSIAYILFFPYLLFSLIYYFCGELRRLSAFVVGLFSLYGIGFLGYTLIPAAGPYLAFAHEFDVPLIGGQVTQWNAALVSMGSSGVDVFPSLHIAVSSFLLMFDFRHKRWRFWLYIVPCMFLWGATLYLRYHYFIDVLCGFLLAAFAFWLAQRHYLHERITL